MNESSLSIESSLERNLINGFFLPNAMTSGRNGWFQVHYRYWWTSGLSFCVVGSISPVLCFQYGECTNMWLKSADPILGGAFLLYLSGVTLQLGQTTLSKWVFYEHFYWLRTSFANDRFSSISIKWGRPKEIKNVLDTSRQVERSGVR